MFDLSAITAALTASAPSLAQVLIPETQETMGVDSSVVLLSLIEPSVSSRVYPSILPDQVTYPCATYSQVASERIDVNGYPILRSDSFEVYALDREKVDAWAAVNTMRTSLLAYDPTNAAGAAELGTCEDEHFPLHDLHQVVQEVRLTHLARASQALPAAFVFSTGENWEDEGAIGSCIIGTVTSYFDILLVAKMPTGGVSALRPTQKEILDAVVGLQSADWELVHRQDGGRSNTVSVFSSYVLWRESFSVRKTQKYP